MSKYDLNLLQLGLGMLQQEKRRVQGRWMSAENRVWGREGDGESCVLVRATYHTFSTQHAANATVPFEGWCTYHNSKHGGTNERAQLGAQHSFSLF